MSCFFVGHELMIYKRNQLVLSKSFFLKGRNWSCKALLVKISMLNNNKIIEYFIFLDEIKELEKYFQINSEMAF